MLYLNNCTFSLPGFYIIFAYLFNFYLPMQIFSDRDLVQYVKYQSRDSHLLWKVTRLGFMILWTWSLVWNFHVTSRLPKVSDCLRKSPAYKLLRVLSLSRMLVEFSLTCISHHVLEKFLNLWYSYSYKMHWVYIFLLMPHLPIQNSKQNFLKIGFPEDERGWENYDLLYQISIKNMKRIWNIRLFIFCIIYNSFDIIYDGWTV